MKKFYFYAKVFVKRLLGVTIVLLSVGMGIYFGLYQCLFNSIVEIINAVKAGFDVIPITWGLIKIVGGIPTIWYCTIICIIQSFRFLLDDFP